MLKQLSLVGTALAIGLTALAPTAASAQSYDRGYPHYQDQGQYRDQYQGRDDRDQQRGYDRGRYARGRYRCNSGATGTILGAIAGGLLGHSVAGRGDGALGAVLGAGGGALAGRAIDRSGSRDCRR